MQDITQTRPEAPVGRQSATGRESVVAVVAGAVAALIWAASSVAGVDLTVHSGSGSRPVDLVSAIVTAVVVAVAGAGLLRLLERRTTNGLRVWTIVAVAVWAVSFVGPLSAMQLEGGLALATMHLAVGSVVVGGLRRTRVA